MKKWLKVTLALVAAVMAIAIFGVGYLLYSKATRVKIFNQSAVRITELNLKLTHGSAPNEKIKLHSIPDLAPGEFEKFRLWEGDSELSILYKQGTKDFELECGYVANIWDTFEVYIRRENEKSECVMTTPQSIASAAKP